jgi:L-asparaginase II
MNSQPFELIFELHRGSIPESLHYGAVAVANAQGQLVAAWGDPHTLAYLRSSAKPFQAVPLLERGGREHYALTDEEIAVMCASHSGTDAHVAAVRSIQAKCALHEADLLCGVHPLSHQPTLEAMRQRGESLSPNRSNCSGKHSGMLALANMLAAPLEDYINPSHPIQKLILETYASFCGLDPQQVVVGIDGCSAPNFAVPLLSSAAAFARLCAPAAPGLGFPSDRVQACRTITHAMISHPEMVGGPASFDTHLLRVMSGRLVAKVGAEGFQGIGLMPGALYPGSPALGITYKISDGDLKSHTRPVGDSHGQVRPAVAVEILRQLGALQPADLAALQEYGPTFPVYNWRGLLAGGGRPAFKLEIHQHLLEPQPGRAGY